MSVYSGFATRQQESTYNKFVLKLIQILSDEVLAKRRNVAMVQGKFNLTHLFVLDTMSILTTSDGFEKKIVKLFKALRLME